MTVAEKAPAPRPRPRSGGPEGSRGDGMVGVTLRVPPKLHNKAKRLALDISEKEGRTVPLVELFLQGLALAFLKHGQPMPPIDE